MYKYLLIYCLISLSIGITSYFTLYIPMCKILKKDYDLEPEGCIALYEAFRYILVSSIFAPFMVVQTLRGCTTDFVEKVVEEMSDD